MPRPIVNLADAPFSRDTRHGDRFEARIAPLSPLVGARKLGYNVTVVPPGKRAFPFHNHHANEEMFFIVEGEGTLRYGAEEHPVRAGDVIGSSARSAAACRGRDRRTRPSPGSSRRGRRRGTGTASSPQ